MKIDKASDMNNQEPSFLQRRRKRRIVGIIAVLWTIIILVLFMTPQRFLPRVRFWALDELFHFGSLLVFSFLYLRAFYRGRNRIFLFVFLFAIFFGIAVEFLQAFLTRSRSFQVSDILFDIYGVSAGVFLFWLVKSVSRVVKRRRK